MPKSIYLDYASATPVDSQVIEAMKPYWSDKFYNPSATYLSAKSVADDIKLARKTVSNLIGSRSSEIYFVAGGTEANNLAVQGIMRKFPKSNVVTSAIEHSSVLNPVGLFNHKIVGVSPEGIVDLNSLAKAIDDNTVLVSVMYVNNEIGTVEPLAKIAKIIREIISNRNKRNLNLPLYLHVDACQAPLYFDIHVNKLGADLMTLNGGKIYGPKQSGILYIKTGTQILPQILGGGQENGIRSGTENVANIVGFAKALEIAQKTKQLEAKRILNLRDMFIKLAKDNMDKSFAINGSIKNRSPNNINITIFGKDNERLVMELDERGIESAVGSACSASDDEPSHVLKAIGLSDDDARSTLRFSFGKHTTEKDINLVVQELVNCL